MRETDIAMRRAAEGEEIVQAEGSIEPVAIGTAAGSDPDHKAGSDMEE